MNVNHWPIAAEAYSLRGEIDAVSTWVVRLTDEGGGEVTFFTTRERAEAIAAVFALEPGESLLKRQLKASIALEETIAREE